MVKRLWSQWVGATWRSEIIKELDICLVVAFPFLWQVIFVVDGFNWTHWFTCSAIDAFIRVDVQHSIAFVDAVNGAFVDAASIFHIHARQGDDVRHVKKPPLVSYPDSSIESQVDLRSI